MDDALHSSVRSSTSTRRQRTLTVSFRYFLRFFLKILTFKIREPQQIPVTREQYTILALISFVNFTSNVAFTILATFFDDNAKEHGLSRTQTGLIVAIFAGIAVLASVGPELSRSLFNTRISPFSDGD